VIQTTPLIHAGSALPSNERLHQRNGSWVFVLSGWRRNTTPFPWASLDYNETEGAYMMSSTKEQLQAAPAGSIDELTRDDGLQHRDRVYDYYKAPRYWETHCAPRPDRVLFRTAQTKWKTNTG